MTRPTFCFKTGCAVYLEGENTWLDASDLYIIGDVVVAFSANVYAHLSKEEAEQKITYTERVYVSEKANYFFQSNESGSYIRGVFIALQKDCALNPAMWDHKEGFYRHYELQFVRRKVA